MSKNNSKSGAKTHDPATHTSSAPLPAFQVPEGMKERTSDVAGFWVPDAGHIHFIPRIVKAFDGSIEKHKPSILIIGTLVEPCQGSTKDDDGEKADITLQAGDTVGVWGKPGMRDIRDCRGIKTIIRLVGEKEVGKPNPMKVFKVYAPDGGAPLTIDEDDRKESAGAKTFLDRRGNASQPSRPQPSDNMGVPLDSNGKPMF